MNLSAYEAVLFDMDGVVLNSMRQHAASWERLFKKEGVEVPLEFIFENEGSLGEETLIEIFAKNNKILPSSEAKQAMKRLLDTQARLYLDEYASGVSVYPGIRRFLSFLSESGKKTALVTSSRRPLVERCLAPDILAGFSAVVTAEDVARHKPYPDPYLAGANSLGFNPRDCIVLENAPAGIQSALAAGAQCLAVTTTLSSSHLGSAKAVFSDLFSVMRYLGWNGSE